MIFPFVEPVEETNEDLPIAREWAWDFSINDFALDNKKPYLVEGLEAVKIWAYKALLTERYKHPFYSFVYGSEVNSLIGSGYSRSATESEAKRLVEECLLENDYITSIQNFKLSLDSDSLSMEFILVTVYGEVEVRI